MSHHTAGVTPSYNRRISALIHATEQLVRSSQDSAHEDADQLGTLGQPTGDDPTTVVGVVRTASFSRRSKATLTRAPSSAALAARPSIRVQRTSPLEPIENTATPLRLKTEDSVLRQGVHAYLSKAPSPSSAVTAPPTLKLSMSLRRQPPVREPGLFPENVDEVDDQIVLARDVNRTGRGITSFDIRGVDTRIDRGPKVEMQPDVPVYNEKALPRVPSPEPRESPIHSGILPPPPLPPLPPLPPPSSNVQGQPDRGSSQPRRQESFGSETLTRVSSLLSRLSKSTVHSTGTKMSRESTRKTRHGTVIPPPLPPPPLPLPLAPGQAKFPTFRVPHHDGGMTDHELMERAGTLERMAPDNALPWQSGDRNRKPLPAPNPPLDEAYLYHQNAQQQQAQSSSGKGCVHKRAASKANSVRSMFSYRSDRSKYRTPALSSSGVDRSMSGDGNGCFTQLEDEKKRQYDGQMRAFDVYPGRPHKVELGRDVRCRNARRPSPKEKRWTSRSKLVAVALFLLALIGLVVGLVAIFTRSTSSNQASTCTGLNTTGRLCDIGTWYLCSPLQ